MADDLKLPPGAQLVQPDDMKLPPGASLVGAPKLGFSGPPPKSPTLPKTEAPGFFSTLGTDLLGVAQLPFRALNYLPKPMGVKSPPLPRLRDIAGPRQEDVQRIKDSWKKGDYLDIAENLSRLIPLLGPMVGDIKDDIEAGNYGRAGARLVELFGPEMARPLDRLGIPIRRTVENVNNPVTEKALQSVTPEVRMTPGQRSGQAGLQTAERDLLNKPGTSTAAHEFYAGQQEDLARAGRGRAQTPGGASNLVRKPAVTSPYGAGSEVSQTLQTRITGLKSYADKLYDSTRKTTARNIQEVQTGVKEVPGPNPRATLTPAGDPVEVAVMEKLETPVTLAPIRSQLKSVYEDLQRTFPEARRANSPAFRALDEFMRSDKPQMNAMDFDKFLSAVKSITRDGSSQYLTSQSQGLAKQVIRAGESEFQKAIQGAGPNVADKLDRARKAVREYHDTADFLGDLQSEPAALYSNLVTGGDRVRDTLTYLNRTAPNSIRTVARTFLEEMMDKATREGGWGRSAGVLADWNRLGPGTKQILFGQAATESLDDFLLAAKKLTPVVGSPTADRLSALMSYGDIGVAISEFVGGSMAGHPTLGALAAGGTLLKTRMQPAILARLSFKPKGAALLKQAITVPVNSPAFNQTMRALTVMANDEQQAEDRLGKPLP
jgi:hypothetical protein